MEKELIIEAKKENLKSVISFIQEALSEGDYSPAQKKQTRLCSEEIFINIVRHGYKEEPGNIRILADSGAENGSVKTISFIDEGEPFDPLSAAPPDMSLSLEETPVGGLGIHLVRSVADNMTYAYQDGKNILTIQIGDPANQLQQ